LIDSFALIDPTGGRDEYLIDSNRHGVHSNENHVTS